MLNREILGILLVLCSFGGGLRVGAEDGMLNPESEFAKQTFWDNRDWEWFASNIPLMDCPDSELVTTYYYRWELVTKHLTYGAPNSGYSFTEFIDRPFWSGAYGAISCPAGHQIYETRWLHNPTYARDYVRYWLKTPGAQPRNYSTWLVDAAWGLEQVQGDSEFLKECLPGFVANYRGWEQRHFVPEVGLFWQTGHDDGMEFNINSRQTKDILRGAPSYRPSFNAYMWADAKAIARIARLAGDESTSAEFEAKANQLQERMLALLWDSKRQFFFPVYKNDEERDGFKIQALSKTYETGRFAGDPHGRELIGYVPWQFNMVPANVGYENAWRKLFDPDGFASPYGPTTVERNDPMFLLQPSCCWWSGQSWPYGTAQTLKAMANLLQSPTESMVTKKQYVELLQTFSRSHRKNGSPYLAEALHPFTGSFSGHDGYNHSEHYFHSSFNDLVITGLFGIVTRDDDAIEVQPLIPEDWSYACLDRVPYRGHMLSVLWDKDGSHYGKGKGFQLFVDGKSIHRSDTLGKLLLPGKLPVSKPASSSTMKVNYAVNNDGTYYPRVSSSFVNALSPLSKVHDGNYWYSISPPNRWTAQGSQSDRDWIAIDFGMERLLDEIVIYPLDDSGTNSPIRTAKSIDVEVQTAEEKWVPLAVRRRQPDGWMPHRANHLYFDPTKINKVRISMLHDGEFRSGLTEIECWGPASRPIEGAPAPKGNLASKSSDPAIPVPKASASHTSRFDRVEFANDGITQFASTPNNRWTSYESKSDEDWLEIDFGREVEFSRLELGIYDDRGGVQAPKQFFIEFWDGDGWQTVKSAKASPEKPIGGQFNSVTFELVRSNKVRIRFVHRANAKSGVTEVMVWRE